MLSLLLACTAPPTPAADTSPAYTCAAEVPEGRVSLPEDEQPTGASTEWWYWTGHLQDEAGRWYGFEQVFFLFKYGRTTYEMVHSAVVDVDADVFTFDEAYEPWDGGVPEEGFAFSLGDWSAAGGGGHDVLEAEVGDYALDLTLDDAKQPVLQHGDGYHDYDVGGFTYYYSRTRMNAAGTLEVGGEDRAVTGSAWFDRQWGQLGTAIGTGWDWFAIQLDDGREIMIFLVRGADGTTLAGGTLVGDDCVAEEIPALTVTATGSWSPDEDCTYPAGWDIVVGDLTLTVTPVRADQELVAPGVQRYWEGAATVTGDATGRAYIELTEYCEA